MNSYMHQRQQGVALAISLILLVALTILGVATLTSTRFQEQITSNAQQKAVAFEAAESGINSVLARPSLVVDSIVDNPTGSYHDPAPVSLQEIDDLLSANLDQTKNNIKSLDISSKVTVQYCGERVLQADNELVGDLSQVRLVAMVFDVNGIADIANTNASSDHVQRASFRRPETMRTGNCTTPTP